jgi:ATP-dependent 26S proteasome regulatory subunit
MLNQLLEEMDGLQSTAGVFVLGATNRREMLDEALLRGGRLGRQIEIPLPDRDGREAMLRLFTRRMSLAADVSLAAFAAATDGRSGADLQGLCQQAAIEAMMRGAGASGAAPLVTKADFDAAITKLPKGDA